MRSKPASSLQKTFDECFLTCSTAIYFESQNNESEALRFWRDALDQIYYHNAYRMPTSYRPKSESEKALFDSLRGLELQCKERVDLLEALKKSREDARAEHAEKTQLDGGESSYTLGNSLKLSDDSHGKGSWLGEGTVPPVDYPDLARPPPLPQRPLLPPRNRSGNESVRNHNSGQSSPGVSLPDLEAVNPNSRTPSPDKRGRMLRTSLRPHNREGKGSSSKLARTLRTQLPGVSASAATQAWCSSSRSASDKLRPQISGLNRDSTYAAQSSIRRVSLDRKKSDDYTTQGAYDIPGTETHAQPNLLSSISLGKTRKNDNVVGHHTFVSLEGSVGHEINLPTRSRTGMPTSKIEFGNLDTAGSYESTSHRYHAHYPITRDYSTGQHRDMFEYQKPEEFVQPMNSKGSMSIHTTLEDANTRPTRERSEAPQRKDKLSKPSDPDSPTSPTSEGSESGLDSEDQDSAWKSRATQLLKHLPKGVDALAAKQILNEIVIHGDEVHWDDVAGLDVAKAALKETVVYPFLRPDLFMGLREPARGMLLFGPPGTGKTMLARAVATESKSTFFAISASSLTSKYLGESEKLVRALFVLAKTLAPSIIFVDEIDSLLSSRAGSGEHEATRRIKTEFLIQWSDLAKAAAGREQSEKERERGDASRVLVLAATNLPWAIDEAARRRFVRRQYIPLPEDHVRKTQLKTLLSHQKHDLTDQDLDQLVVQTDGFSGSDITALAKDAAMGPLRSLGEKLLHMAPDEIRPIEYGDFKASLSTIRPSVSKEGLKQFEDWAKEFGERGG